MRLLSLALLTLLSTGLHADATQSLSVRETGKLRVEKQELSSAYALVVQDLEERKSLLPPGKETKSRRKILARQIRSLRVTLKQLEHAAQNNQTSPGLDAAQNNQTSPGLASRGADPPANSPQCPPNDAGSDFAGVVEGTIAAALKAAAGTGSPVIIINNIMSTRKEVGLSLENSMCTSSNVSCLFYCVFYVSRAKAWVLRRSQINGLFVPCVVYKTAASATNQVDMSGAFQGNNNAVSGTGDVDRQNGVDMSGAFQGNNNAVSGTGDVDRQNGVNIGPP